MAAEIAASPEPTAIVLSAPSRDATASSNAFEVGVPMRPYTKLSLGFFRSTPILATVP